jgi:transcriptional regulator with XRE-family HTH domain
MPGNCADEAAALLAVFGQNLRAARRAAGRSQISVSADSGVTRDLVGAVERGRSNATVRLLVRLARSVNGDVPTMLTSPSLHRSD